MRTLIAHPPIRLPLVTLLLSGVIAACATGSGGLGPVPTPPVSPTPSIAEPSPDQTPPSTSASPSPGPTPGASSAPTPAGPPSPDPSPASTVVRAYFLLADGPTGGGGLVPVLVEVPATKAVARAAMTALLAGYAKPGTYSDAYQSISTAIPTGTTLLGIDIADDVATVDLSGEFEAGGGSASMFARLGQVVYTLTQFSTVDSVRLRIDGRSVSLFSSEGIVIDHPLTRADFEDQLPAIFVDGPAWGAAAGNPVRVTGTANVFEAQFRVAVVAGDGTVVADVPVMATCGTGCRGTFDVTVPYPVTRGGWGTLRVYDRSARDGSVIDLREYPVYLATAQ
jgi:germination protein M